MCVFVFVCVCVQPTACYKPSQTAQYTEDSDWTPFDLLSRLVKEWEAAGRLPEDVAQKTKQVVIRPGTQFGMALYDPRSLH